MIEFGIYVHQDMPKGVQELARNFHDNCLKKDSNSFLKEFRYPGDLAFVPPSKRALIVGGDGTVRRCLEWWDQTNSPEVVGIKAVGTNNVLHGALTDSGLVVPEGEFLEDSLPNLTEYPGYLPGSIGRSLFTNTLSTSQYDIPNRLTNEFIRSHVPVLSGKNRTRAAYMVGLFVTAMKVKGDTPLLNMILTTPFLGFVRLCPDQNTLGLRLTRVSIEGEPKEIMLSKLVNTLVALNKGKPPKPGVLRFETAEQFCMVNGGNSITLDGDLQQGVPKVVEVRRSDRPFKIVALT